MVRLVLIILVGYHCVFSIRFNVGSSGSEMFSHAAISVPSPMAAGPRLFSGAENFDARLKLSTASYMTNIMPRLLSKYTIR